MPMSRRTINNSNAARYMAYIAAFVIVAIWGATFVQTKLLINAGLRPDEIFFYRFLIAYLLILPFSCRKLFLDNWADEFLAFSLGITGGVGMS